MRRENGDAAALLAEGGVYLHLGSMRPDRGCCDFGE